VISIIVAGLAWTANDAGAAGIRQSTPWEKKMPGDEAAGRKGCGAPGRA